jgi:hypothetical protein
MMNRANWSAVIGIDVALNDLSSFLETLRVGENGWPLLSMNKGRLWPIPKLSLARAEGEIFRPCILAK